MSKRKSYRPKSTSVPMLVTRELEKNVESVEENAMILAFRTGYAQKHHYDYLIRMGNTMNISNSLKPSAGADALMNLAKAVAESVLARYKRSGKFGLTAQELEQMKQLVQSYDLYWKQQTTAHYNECIAELNAFYAEMEEKRAA
jgi:hypothetical protein